MKTGNKIVLGAVGLLVASSAFIIGSSSFDSAAENPSSITPRHVPTTSVKPSPKITSSPTIESPIISPTRKPVSTSTPSATSPNKATTTKTPTYNCSADTYNCSDFSTCSQAQAILKQCSTDIHGLDRNKDGQACDALCN